MDGGGARVRKGVPFVGKWNERWKEGGKKVEFWFEFERFLSSNDFSFERYSNDTIWILDG